MAIAVSHAPVSTPVAPVLNAHPSNKQMRDLALLKLSKGEYTLEQCQADLAKYADTPKVVVSRVQARKTPKGTVWLSLGYKASAGNAGSTTLPRMGWEAIVKLVNDGTIPGLLRDWDNIPQSSSCV